MKNIPIILILFISFLLPAQKPDTSLLKRPSNQLYFNMLGSGCIFSINYERLINISNRAFLTGSLGIGYNEQFLYNFLFKDAEPKKTYLMLPHHISFNLGGPNSFFEVGLGGTRIFGDYSSKYMLYPIIAYRYHRPLSSKLVFRAFANYPIWGYDKENPIILLSPFGISFGISF